MDRGPAPAFSRSLPRMPASLSIIIVAKNEARQIADCVRCALFADEVLVLDSGSSDGTPALARDAGARVVETDWPGYGAQKNRGIDLAQGDWLFFLDADERITPALARALRQAIDGGGCDAFRVPRRSSYCGRVLRHGGWWPDYTVRLARRGKARFSQPRVHESLLVQGRTGTLGEPLLHESFASLEEVLDKVNRYSSAGAQDLADRGRQGSFTAALMHGAWAFVRTYVLRLGFLDGRWGFMLAVSNAEGTYYRYLKLWLASQRARP